jgi:hypothetical protein
MNFDSVKIFSTFQKAQFQSKAGRNHLSSGLANEVYGGGGGATRCQEVVD